MTMASFPKKKTRQLKLGQQHKRRPKNFQNKPIEKCRWDPNLHVHVFEPPKCTREIDPLERSHARCCGSCFLRPCLMEGKEISFIECLKATHNDPDAAVANAKILANNFMLVFFGKTCVGKNKLANSAGESKLSCVSQALPHLLDVAALQIQERSSIGPGDDTMDSLINWRDDDDSLSE